MKKVLIVAGLMVASIAHANIIETTLQKAINQVGDPCNKVTQVFHNGTDKNGSMHISVACSGGQNYFVLAKRNGESKILECAMIDKISGGRGKPGSCFTKY
jgi:hypothetical protein